ncbi:MAG: SWIM zinc finger family protein [Lewinella sp.]|nr:SWIM zinc finger family protein [Lewinella sp.]
MSFSLEKFEARLPKDIVKKGHAYFTGFLVEDLTRDGDRWQADVYGTSNYTVDVVIKEGEVVSWFCDCPYDWGPICKHVTAVFLCKEPPGASWKYWKNGLLIKTQGLIY